MVCLVVVSVVTVAGAFVIVPMFELAQLAHRAFH